MATSGNTPDKISLYPDQLTSLLSLARVLPARKYAVLMALLSYLEGNSLKSTATREQVKELTGLGKRTIYSHIREFEKCGFIKAWRGPFETKQKFYKINLPVAADVLEFYGGAKAKIILLQTDGKEDGKDDDMSEIGFVAQSAPPVVQDVKDTILSAQLPISNSARQDSSREASPEIVPSCSEDVLRVPADVSTTASDSTDLLTQDVPRDPCSDFAGTHDKRPCEPETDSLDANHDLPESFFDDPRLDALVAQVERAPKFDTRLLKWFKSENLLTYWPPTDSYRVEKQLLRDKVNSLDELNAILTARVREDYEWFVSGFLQCCSDNGYEVKDTSKAFSFEINMLLDVMLNPARRDRALWTTESVRAQMKMIIEEWSTLMTWTQLSLPIKQPSEPTLEFFITNPALWQAARERWTEQNEAKVLRLLEEIERAGTA